MHVPTIGGCGSSMCCGKLRFSLMLFVPRGIEPWPPYIIEKNVRVSLALPKDLVPVLVFIMLAAQRPAFSNGLHHAGSLSHE